MSQNTAVLIAGGYGVVGEQVAELLRARNPETRLLIGGRDKENATAVAKRLGNADAVTLDVLKPGNVTALADQLSAVVPVVNDRKDYLLVESIRAKIPFVDITRWTAWQRQSIIRATFEDIKSPVVFSSAWMAGVVAMVSKKLAEGFSDVDSIDIDVLFSLQDKAGPNSIEYVDQLRTPYLIYKDGEMGTAMPMTEPKMSTFAGGEEFTGLIPRTKPPCL